MDDFFWFLSEIHDFMTSPRTKGGSLAKTLLQLLAIAIGTAVVVAAYYYFF